MPSKKVFGADNQQERLRMGSWVSGFTDGEGCFSVSLIRNSTTRFGKQVFPEFVITQSAKSLDTLQKVKDFFHCGNIFVNKRYDNHNEHLYRYCVRALPDLRIRIIPHFDEFPLLTYKKNDFLIFKKIIEMIANRHHFTEEGFREIVELAGTMNRKKNRS